MVSVGVYIRYIANYLYLIWYFFSFEEVFVICYLFYLNNQILQLCIFLTGVMSSSTVSCYFPLLHLVRLDNLKLIYSNSIQVERGLLLTKQNNGDVLKLFFVENLTFRCQQNPSVLYRKEVLKPAKQTKIRQEKNQMGSTWYDSLILSFQF